MCVLVFGVQGEEGPPSLEYIQAKDLFPHKELVKEEESLQVSLQGPAGKCSFKMHLHPGTGKLQVPACASPVAVARTWRCCSGAITTPSVPQI